MIIVLKRGATAEELDALYDYVKQFKVYQQSIMQEKSRSILALMGDAVSSIDVDRISAFPCVESVYRVDAPYPLASREHSAEDTVVRVQGVKLGGGGFTIIAGPCSVETSEQISDIACAVRKAGASILRGGAYKPRSSPYTFQGLGRQGLSYLSQAKLSSGMPTVSEVVDVADLDMFEDVDILQVGARNMHNYSLLKALGRQEKPVLIKRGYCATLEELLLSAEYVLSGGNQNVILCERGIRTFENATRNTLDISAIPVLKRLTHLPVIVDPSHAAGNAELVSSLSLASVAAGADGLMLEVHSNPSEAFTDGCQALTIDEFETLASKIGALTAFMGVL